MSPNPLSTRSTAVLCVLTVLPAALSCWALAPEGTLPASGLIDPVLLPYFLGGFALLLGTLGAPLIFPQEQLRADPPQAVLFKAAVAALWLGAAAVFSMLAAARLAPISVGGAVQAALWTVCCAWLSILFERILPRAGSAVLFFWIVALPVCAYMTAEVFLMSPAGGGSVLESGAAQAGTLRSAIRWTLNLSPGTGTYGALTGKLPFGFEYSAWGAAIGMAVCAAGVAAGTAGGLGQPRASKQPN